ncbi:uncharacterized protein LOC143084398 isoform X2 [Mytilus galloprovincialis]|uniref:uncharacterized protein LOC143084398 isoform X2 n=1 Tax=Mytilus galloprovincialis TaxID=29158 RepID=UPI003F7CA1CC
MSYETTVYHKPKEVKCHSCIMDSTEITREQIDLPRQWEGKLAYLLHNVLSKKECDDLIKKAEDKGFEPTFLNCKGRRSNGIDEYGNCSRCTLELKEVADTMWRRVGNLIPEIWNNRKVVGLNERIRVLRYNTGDNFHPHLDGSYISEEGDISYMSVQVYLNQNFEGGNTTFLCMLEEDKTEIIPQTGSMLIFEHDILHEGSKILSGRKYVLRSDVMYSGETIPKKSKLSRLCHLFKT